MRDLPVHFQMHSLDKELHMESDIKTRQVRSCGFTTLNNAFPLLGNIATKLFNFNGNTFLSTITNTDKA